MRDLTVEVPCGQALTQQFDAVHLGLCAASAVIPAPLSPDASPDTFRRAPDFVAGDSSGGVGLPGSGVLSRWDDRIDPTGSDGVVALVGIEGTVGCDSGDLLPGRDLVKQIGQHRGIANIACGELGGPDLQGFLVYADVDLAPDVSTQGNLHR